MLTYYKYKLDKGMITLSQVPEPYQTQLRALGYTDPSDPEPATEAGLGE
ncbi:hypothetical protein [Paenibacillus silvisoli]|nr:hypothetical protein [Paenibacillus silvisoli]